MPPEFDYMTPPNSGSWDIKPHTEAKHAILKRYLQAWVPILTQGNFPEILYVDRFAGPGRYSKGEDGSPIIALKEVLKFKDKIKSKITFLFIEKNINIAQKLHDALQLIETPDNFVVEIEPGNTFESTLNCKLDIYKKEGQGLPPTFAFVDPFGWTGFPFSIIQRILKHKSCEVFVNFMYEEINRFLSHPNPKYGEKFNILFGTDEWKNGVNLKKPLQRDRFLHDLYGQQLRKNAKYVRSFRMRNNNNAIDYYLFYATNNLLGLKKMKAAMWKVDETGELQFSDATDPNQLVLFGQRYPDCMIYLRKEILDHFEWRRMVTIREIEEFVLSETAFRETHYKKILRYLSNNPNRR